MGMNNCAIEVHDLAYSFNNRLLFNGLNFNIVQGSITSIVGTNNSGKTTLIRILSALYFTEDCIKIGNISLNTQTLSSYKKKVAYIDFNQFKFSNNSVYEEIMNQLQFTKWSMDNKNQKIHKVLTDLHLLEYKDRATTRLSKKNKIHLLLAKALVFSPKVLLMELSDLSLNEEDKKYIFSILFKYVSKNMTILYSTNNSEDIIYSNRMLVLHRGNIAIEGDTMAVLKEDSLLLKLGIELPFMVDLSNKLKFYEVIHKTYLNEEDLVNALWK